MGFSRKLAFKPGRVPTVAFLIVFPILLALGSWQLDRSEKKSLLVQQKNERTNKSEVALENFEVNIEDLRYLSVKISGRYDGAHQFLLDNQSVQMKPGYFVLTPLIVAGKGFAVLVNRGWVPLGVSREILPDIALVEESVSISGIIDVFPGVGYRLEGAENPTDNWPAVVQLIDVETLSKLLDYPLLPYQVLLKKGQPGGYLREWESRFTETITPEKHVGYAVQWFSLGFVLAVIFLWNGFKKNER
ncbi:MAG: SURF1 family protein [Methylococcales bacterium]